MNFYNEEKDLNKMDMPPSDLQNQEKVKLMDVFVSSFMKPAKLVDIVIRNRNRFRRYVIFISILVAVMIFVIPVATRVISFGGFHKLFKDKMPQIEMVDGRLQADKRFEMNLGTSTILIDTSLEEYTFEDFETEGYFIAFGADRVKFARVGDTSNPESYTVIYSYSNKALFPSTFNNAFMVKCIPLIYLSFFIVFVVMVLLYGLRYWVFAVIYAVLSRSLTAIIKVQLTFKDAIQLCFYAQTLAILLTNLNSASGYFIYPTFASILGVIITVIIIRKAVRPHMPSLDDLLNNMKGNNNNRFF